MAIARGGAAYAEKRDDFGRDLRVGTLCRVRAEEKYNAGAGDCRDIGRDGAFG